MISHSAVFLKALSAISLAFSFCSFHPQMAQRKIRDILAQVKQQHQKGQSGQLQARRK